MIHRRFACGINARLSLHVFLVIEHIPNSYNRFVLPPALQICVILISSFTTSLYPTRLTAADAWLVPCYNLSWMLNLIVLNTHILNTCEEAVFILRYSCKGYYTV